MGQFKFSIFLVALFAGLVLFQAGSDLFSQEPDENHLIYVYDPEIPPFRKWKHHQTLIDQRRQSPPKSVEGFEETDPRKRLQWSFELTKKTFDYGEIVWGKLKVSNTSSSSTFVLSPPGNSRYISTIGVWTRSRKGHENRDGDEISELTESTELNKGNYYNHFFYRGRPISIGPGKAYEVMIPVNVNQIANDDTGLLVADSDRVGWVPCAKYGKGKHQFYLQYVNAEGVSWWPYSAFFTNARPDGILPPKHSRFDSYPLVLGPYEFEVAPRFHNTPQLFENYRNLPTPPPDDKWEVLHPAPHDRLISKMKPDVRWQFEFMYLKNSYPTYQLEFADGAGPSDVAKTNLKLQNLEAVLSHLAEDSPLRNFVQMERCELLNFLGYPEEAIALAKQVDSPDTQVFLDLMTFGEGKFQYDTLKSGVRVTQTADGLFFVRLELKRQGWRAELRIKDAKGRTVLKNELTPWRGGVHRSATIFGVHLAKEQLANCKIFCFNTKEQLRYAVRPIDFWQTSEADGAIEATVSE